MTDDADSTAQALPINAAANVLAVIAGAFLLSSQMTLIDVAAPFFADAAPDLDGTQLADRDLRVIGVVWPVLALALAIFAGLRRSSVAISVGFGILMLTASYGTALSTSYVREYGFVAPSDAPVNPTVLIVGALSVVAVGMAIWWILELVRRSASRSGTLPLLALGAAAWVLSMVVSIVSVVGHRRDFDIPLLPSLATLVFIVVAVAALLTGTRAGLVLAAAVAAARLLATFDLVVIRGFPLSAVADTIANKLVLIGIAVALLCALAGLLPSSEVMRSGAGSLRSKLALADEWDD